MWMGGRLNVHVPFLVLVSWNLSDEILRAIADEEIFAMCRGVKVDADVVEAARAELERRRAASGE